VERRRANDFRQIAQTIVFVLFARCRLLAAIAAIDISTPFRIQTQCMAPLL
jgi:hypothetical protein